MRNCTTFQYLLKLLSKKLVAEAVKRYEADYYIKRFKTWDHLVIMLYAQLTQAKSLREIELGFNSQPRMCSLIENKKIHRSTLSDANERQPAECFIWIADQLMSGLPRKLRQEIGKVVRLLDSSPIQLKGRGYEWAISRRTLRCQGLKLHVEYDATLAMPARVKMSDANVNDCTLGQRWPIVEGTVYVFDKGYYDYNWWWKIHKEKAYFVTRLKENAAIEKVEERKVEGEAILEDSHIRWKNKNPRGGKKNLYTDNLRCVVVKREGNKKPLVMVTNLLTIPAKAVADIYKSRWDIELFFKWIKQNLKIKKFLGRSENAVKLQLISGLITYLLIALYRATFKNKLSLQHTLIWIRHNLLTRKTIYITKDPPLYRITPWPVLLDLHV